MKPEALFPAGVEATLAAASVQPSRAARARTPNRRVSFSDETPKDKTDVVETKEKATAKITRDKSRKSAGSAELWQAVHKGDCDTIKKLVEKGACWAGLRDASGHSVLWHLVAWGHYTLALFMIDRFPFGSEGAGEAGDVHPTRGDTLLHLLGRARPFGAEAGEVFKRVAKNSKGCAFFCHRNANGETFLDVAAAALNFWAVKFTARNFPSQFKAFVCIPASTNETLNAPLRNLARHLTKPQIPLAPTHDRHPEHLNLVQMLKADVTTGLVPYADVAFDVGPSSTQRSTPIQAHRAIVGSRSPVLLEECRRKPLEPLPQLGGLQVCSIRVDCRISKDVFLCALNFIYSGEMHCSFLRETSKMTEMFLLCCLYQLPRPLMSLTSIALCGLLPTAKPKETIEVLSIASSCSRDATNRNTVANHLQESAAYWFLRNAHEACSEMTPADTSKLVEHALDVLEASMSIGCKS